MDTKIRKLIIWQRMYHPSANIENLVINKENGARGWIQQELINKTITTGLKKYLGSTTGWMLQLVNTHEKQQKNIQ